MMGFLNTAPEAVEGMRDSRSCGCMIQAGLLGRPKQTIVSGKIFDTVLSHSSVRPVFMKVRDSFL